MTVPNFFRLPYDPEKDLIYIARFVISAYPVMVRANSPWQTWAELLEYARSNPGWLRWSTSGINGAPHIAVEAAFRQEGVRTRFVPMQGSPEIPAGLLGDTLDMGGTSDYVAPYAAGDIRLLAEIGPKRFPDLDGLPDFGELGYPLAPTIFFGLVGPASLPAASWTGSAIPGRFRSQCRLRRSPLACLRWS